MNTQMQPFVLQVNTGVKSLKTLLQKKVFLASVMSVQQICSRIFSLLLEEPHGSPGLDEKCSPSSMPWSPHSPLGFVGQQKELKLILQRREEPLRVHSVWS